LQSRIADLRAAGAEVLAVCIDSVEQNAKVVDKLQLDYPILSDSELIAIDRFGLRHEEGEMLEGKDIARPAVFVLDRDGIVRWRALTDNWRVRTARDGARTTHRPAMMSVEIAPDDWRAREGGGLAKRG